MIANAPEKGPRPVEISDVVLNLAENQSITRGVDKS